MNRIAGGIYEGIHYVGNKRWEKKVEDADCTLEISLVCSSDFKEVEFYITGITFNSFNISESQLCNFISESIKKVLNIS